MSLKVVIFFCMLMAAAEARRARILNGTVAMPHEFPYMVSLSSGSYNHVCGGAILNQHWIITAGHCPELVSNLRKFQIMAGKHALSIIEDSQQIIKVAKVIVHKDFIGHFATPNDIALLKLERPLVFNDYVQPVALPEKNTTDDGQLSFSGWADAAGASYPRELKKTQFIAMDLASCQEIDVSLVRSPTAITDTMLCAKSPSPNSPAFACKGDSGGPLIKQENNQTLLVGVFSWYYGPRCGGYPDAPSVFTRVTSYIDWIKTTIANN